MVPLRLIKVLITLQSSPGADAPSDAPRSGTGTAIPESPPNEASPGKDSLVPAFGLPKPVAANSLGMPLTLAPSTSAFKPPSAQRKPPAPQQPAPSRVSESSTMSKFSDMIFGW